MKNRTTYIDENLLVSPSQCDEKVRVFQRKLYITAKRDKRVIYKWTKSKGRKAHRKLRQRPYDNLVAYYKLLDIEKYARLKSIAKA